MQLRINDSVYEREGTSERRMVEDTIIQSRKLVIEQKNRMVVDTVVGVFVTNKKEKNVLIYFIFLIRKNISVVFRFYCIH
jgi:hypothetical protein